MRFRIFLNSVVLITCLVIFLTSGLYLGFLTPWPPLIFFAFLFSAQAIGLLRDLKDFGPPPDPSDTQSRLS